MTAALSILDCSFFGTLRSAVTSRRQKQRNVPGSIVHPHQIKPMRRRDLAAGGAVVGIERRDEVVGAPFAFADMHERADHRAHLVLQERARRRGDAYLVAVTRDVELIQRLHWQLRLALGGPERREVVLADEALRGNVHRGAIEWARHAPGAVLLESEL